MMMAGGQQRVAEAYAECVRLGIPVLPPDVNRSAVNFSLEKQTGRQGRHPLRPRFRQERRRGRLRGHHRDDGARAGRSRRSSRCSSASTFGHLNKRTMESLVKAGAFDTLAERAALLASLDRLIGYAQREQKQRESGQTSLFDLMGGEGAAAVQGPQLETAPEATQQQKLTWEKELLGIYLSEHPFARVAEELRGVLTCGLVEVNADFHNRELLIGGVVSGLRSLSTRDGRQFLAAEIEDMTGSLEVTVWPETLEQTRELWQPGNIVVVNVRVKARDERLQLSVQKASLYGDPSFDLNDLLAGNGGSNGNGYRRNGNGGNGNGMGVPGENLRAARHRAGPPVRPQHHSRGDRRRRRRPRTAARPARHRRRLLRRSRRAARNPAAGRGGGGDGAAAGAAVSGADATAGGYRGAVGDGGGLNRIIR